MKSTFCTIITADYIHYALALNYSLLKYSPGVELKILISDSERDFTDVKKEFSNIDFFYADDLCQTGTGKKIKEKYKDSNMDCFRWSMKSVFINNLLKQGFDQVFCLDSDLYFYSKFDFLSRELESNSIILTPHWRASDPHMDKENFAVLQTSGLYNAGFIGVTKNGISAMDWWANVCEYKCINAPEQGMFVDQAYLDLLSVYFCGVKVVRHKGCNVANWNQAECKRVLLTDGKVRINNEQDIVFIHFTRSTINGILQGEDALLKPYLDEYQASLEKFKHWNKIDLSSKAVPPTIISAKNNEAIHEGLLSPDNFISPMCTPKNQDLFIIRKSIFKSLKKLMPKLSGTLLDVGCGKMPYKSLLLSPPGNVHSYIGLDLESNPIHKNYPDITWQDGKIPLEDNSVDCAISTEVLEHCPNPEAVLLEVNRVLKPTGVFFFTVPFIWPLHEVPYDEYRYTPFSIKRHLQNTGFTDIKIEALGGWDASLAQMLGLWVRRRPMGTRKRAILSKLIFPFYKYLVKKDVAPTEFSKSMMITGLSGVCVKP